MLTIIFGHFSLISKGHKIKRSKREKIRSQLHMYHTNTVYLELMNESSTDCFILSLKQFIARRRQGKRLMSDNWSNVIGAELKLKESLNGIDQELLTFCHSIILIGDLTYLTVLEWVKSVKRALKVAIQNRLIADETFTILMCEV